MDEDLANWIYEKGDWFDFISGNDCYTIVFENPEKWGNHWVEMLKNRMGAEDFERNYEEWLKFDESYRNMSYEIAYKLDIDTTVYPSIIFVNSMDSKDYLILPIAKDKDDFRPFFDKLFVIVRNSIKDGNSPADLNKLQKDIDKEFKYWLRLVKLQRSSEGSSRYINTIREIEQPVFSIISDVLSVIKP